MALITYEEARHIVHDRIRPLAGRSLLALEKAFGFVLSESLAARRGNPAFDNSAVDGYLLGLPAASIGTVFEVVGEIRAGSRPPYPVPDSGQAVRIFTGAPVPPGEFCVAMQEDVIAEGRSIRLNEPVGFHAAVRRAGTDFPAGAELVAAGTRMAAAEIALTAWNGLDTVSVFREPRVAVCVTGDELLDPGAEAEAGQIYDSNGPMMEALVRSVGPATIARSRLGDSYEATIRHLSELSERADLILVSGGASVGDYDHLPAAVAELGETYFHGVRVKPGKPVLFGQIGPSFVFALPGNPASSYVTFELFVRDALRRLGGESDPRSLWIRARYDGEHGPAPRDEFVRVRFEIRDGRNWAVPVHEQGSFGIRSLAAADGLARLTADRRFEPGDRAECLLLPL